MAIPDVDDAAGPAERVDFATEPNGEDGEFLPYLRDPETLARPWAIPGTAGMQHRIGGLEKADRTGNISDPANHDFMTRTRQAKIDGIAASLPPTEVDDPDGDATVAVIGWGSTYGRSAPPAADPAARAARSPRSTCATSIRCRTTSATSWPATTASSAPR